MLLASSILRPQAPKAASSAWAGTLPWSFSNQCGRGVALGLMQRSFRPRNMHSSAWLVFNCWGKWTTASGRLIGPQLVLLSNYSQYECFPLALIFRRISSEHISFSFLVTPPVPLAVASKHDGAISPPVLPGFWKEWIMNSKGKWVSNCSTSRAQGVHGFLQMKKSLGKDISQAWRWASLFCRGLI